MKNLIQRFRKDQGGATAIEYALIASGIALLLIVIAAGIGTTLKTNFTSINSSLK